MSRTYTLRMDERTAELVMCACGTHAKFFMEAASMMDGRLARSGANAETQKAKDATRSVLEDETRLRNAASELKLMLDGDAS